MKFQNIYTATRLFAPIIPKFGVIVKAIKLGQPLPVGLTEDIGFWNAFKKVFSDPQLTEGFLQFCNYYPQLETDLKTIRVDSLKKLTTTPINKMKDVFKNWSDAKAFIKADQADYVSSALNKGTTAVIEFQKDLNALNPEINTLMQDMRALQKLSPGKNYVDEIKTIGDLKSNIIINKRLLQMETPPPQSQAYLDDMFKQSYLDDMFKKLSKLPSSTPISNDAIDAKSAVENLRNLSKQFSPKSTQVTQATADGMEAAGKLGKIFPALAKFTAALGLLFSLPAAYKWAVIIKDEQFLEKMQDADELANFAVDLSNLVSSALMFIPALQPVALIAGGLALGFQGGQAIIHSVVVPNAQDQLINANTPEERQKILDKMSEQDKFDIEHQDWRVNELLSKVEPGYTDFNDYMNSKYPNKAIDPVTKKPKPSKFYDPTSLKILDIINGLTSWIQSLPPNRQKNYSWFINPTDQNKQMKEQFLQKLNQWYTGLKAQKPATTSFNLRKYQLTKIGRQY